VDDYGKKFITHKVINFRHIVVTKEIQTLANLAIRIDLFVSVPTFITAFRFFNSLIEGVINTGFLLWFGIFIGLIIFFTAFPLRNLHKELNTAKEQLLTKIDQEITLITGNNKGIRKLSLFNDILHVRDRVNDMNTWGIDFPMFLKLISTFLIPIVLGALFQLGFEALIQ
jgi:hypothetical protein